MPISLIDDHSISGNCNKFRCDFKMPSLIFGVLTIHQHYFSHLEW